MAGGAISGAAQGAATGASVGGPWGAAAGLVLGGLAGYASDRTRKSGKLRQVSTLDPQQLARQQRFGQLGAQQYQNPYQGFEPIKQQALNNFHSNTVPSIAERFSSLGSGGSQNSSAFAGQLAAAGTGLESELAALQAQYGLQNRQQALRLLNMAQQPNFENYFQGPEDTALSKGFGQLSQGLNAYGAAGLRDYFNQPGGQGQQDTNPNGLTGHPLEGVRNYNDAANFGMNPQAQQQRVSEYLNSSQFDPRESGAQSSANLLGARTRGYGENGAFSASQQLQNRLSNFGRNYNPQASTLTRQLAWQPGY